MTSLLLIVCIFLHVFCASSCNVQVLTNLGWIEGETRKSYNGRIYQSYEGIPYAQPPIGQLRFSAPLPAKPWTGVWRAHASNKRACAQVDHDPTYAHAPYVKGTEDCLYINVYAPIYKTNLPVIVHIHGGAFMFGKGSLYGPDNIMDRNVVYVTFNYRLGPLGFLSTNDEIVPGNAGLKDQNLALKWIQNEISAFGGDPNSVTITGLSAGGASVHYHTLSPLSANLFHKAASFSGTALAPWALVENPLARAQKLAQLLGCPINNNEKLVSCLRERPVDDIVLLGKIHFQPWLYNPYTPWGPVVEPSGTKNAFLSDKPDKILSENKIHDIPWLVGLTSHEGLYPAAEFLYNETYLQQLDINWEKYAKYLLHFEDTHTATHEEIATRIKQEYLGDKSISRDTYQDLVRMVGDRLFVADAVLAARAHSRALAHISKHSKVRAYWFGYRGSHSTSELLAHSDENIGVCHADDVMYVLSPPKSWYKRYLDTKNDEIIAEQLKDMWVNFARNGVATWGNIKWPTVDSNMEDFMFLWIESPGEEGASAFGEKYLGNWPFWHSLPLEENVHLIVNNKNKDEL